MEPVPPPPLEPSAAPLDRREVVFVAETCAAAGLYEKMARELEGLVADLPRQRPPDLSARERELLFAAWQGLIAPKRAAWATVDEALLDVRASQGRGSPRAGRKGDDVATLAEYASTIADEIRAVCERWLATLERLLTQPPVEDAGGLSEESAMFYRADFRLLTLVFAFS